MGTNKSTKDPFKLETYEYNADDMWMPSPNEFLDIIEYSLTILGSNSSKIINRCEYNREVRPSDIRVLLYNYMYRYGHNFRGSLVSKSINNNVDTELIEILSPSFKDFINNPGYVLLLKSEKRGGYPLIYIHWPNGYLYSTFIDKQRPHTYIVDDIKIFVVNSNGNFNK